MFRTLAAVAAGLAAALAAAPASAQSSKIGWKKTVLDDKFRSEGCAIADVNKDGKKDVLVGEFWYEAPDWKRHEMQKPGDYGDGLKGYSRVFCCWPEDLNGDGYPDLIVIDFPGKPAYWLENPKGRGTEADGKPTHWARHVIWDSACNETPQYVDLFGTKKKVLLMGVQPKGKGETGNEGQMAYFTPGPDPTAPWDLHPVSEPSVAPTQKDGKPVPGTGKIVPGTFKFSHGLGIGDLNGDGRMDVITLGGWWEQPEKADGKTAWPFHPGGVTEPSADLYAHDMDGDGKADILASSAHKFGIWWFKQRPADGKGHPTFEKHELFKDLVSETHAAHFVDIDGDGQKDFVTGKRWWSHGRAEPGSEKLPHIYWFKASKAPDGMTTFAPNVIDDDSGIGTQFVVEDINGDGLLDVISSNKKGVRVIVQERK